MGVRSVHGNGSEAGADWISIGVMPVELSVCGILKINAGNAALRIRSSLVIINLFLFISDSFLLLLIQ